jgi:hypothetical protein
VTVPVPNNDDWSGDDLTAIFIQEFGKDWNEWYETAATNQAGAAGGGEKGAGNDAKGAGVQMGSKAGGEEKEKAQGGSTTRVPENPLVREVRYPMGRAAGPEVSYRLTPEAAKLLQPIFKQYGFDPSKVQFQFGWTPERVGAYTVGNRVTINREAWGSMSGLRRLELIAHEAAHSVQYERLGTAGFLSRYVSEYQRPDNYSVPRALEATSFGRVNIVDPRFTLDQLAERVAAEVATRYGP